jgi:hypothetical protein
MQVAGGAPRSRNSPQRVPVVVDLLVLAANDAEDLECA